MDENEERESEPFLSIRDDTQIIGVALHYDMLFYLDRQIFAMQASPECPPQTRDTPLWAERSNFIGRALAYMFEADEIEEYWRDEP